MVHSRSTSALRTRPCESTASMLDPALRWQRKQAQCHVGPTCSSCQKKRESFPKCMLIQPIDIEILIRHLSDCLQDYDLRSRGFSWTQPIHRKEHSFDDRFPLWKSRRYEARPVASKHPKSSRNRHERSLEVFLDEESTCIPSLGPAICASTNETILQEDRGMAGQQSELVDVSALSRPAYQMLCYVVVKQIAKALGKSREARNNRLGTFDYTRSLLSLNTLQKFAEGGKTSKSTCAFKSWL